jgi:hypothetical protein
MRDLSYFRASLRHEQVWRKVYSIFFPSFNSALLEFEEKRLEEVVRLLAAFPIVLLLSSHFYLDNKMFGLHEPNRIESTNVLIFAR